MCILQTADHRAEPGHRLPEAAKAGKGMRDSSHLAEGTLERFADRRMVGDAGFEPTTSTV